MTWDAADVESWTELPVTKEIAMKLDSRVYNIAKNDKWIGMVALRSLCGPVMDGGMHADGIKIHLTKKFSLHWNIL